MAGQTERKQKFSLAYPALASRIAPKAGYFHTFHEKKNDVRPSTVKLEKGGVNYFSHIFLVECSFSFQRVPFSLLPEGIGFL